MKKSLKNHILEIFKTLYEAHSNIKKIIINKDFQNVQSILCDCQNTAIQIGITIESLEGEDHVTVGYLEEYCETVYEVATSISNDYNGNKAQKALDKKLIKAENSVKNDVKVRLEIVFCPYKASMWDSLESVWKAADEDPDCDAYVVPIPYYDRNPDYSFGAFHKDFISRGIWEQKAIKDAIHIIGRTDWDEACVKSINSNKHYYKCPEIMRPLFYDNQNTWNFASCQIHSIFVSQVSYPVKGLHYLLNVLSHIIELFPDTHLYIGGKDILVPNTSGNITPYAIYIKDIISENQLSEDITFLGSLTEEQMVEQYQKCNVFVSASNIENSSNSVCEAQMIGCPVVASNTGGISSIWRENPHSYMYQYNAEYMLEYYIKKVFTEKMYNSTADYLSKDIAVEKTMSVYQRISGLCLEVNQ